MFLMKIIPLISTLRFVCSNYDDFDQNLISSSDSELEGCTAEEEEIPCFCYDNQENGFEYKICPNEPNPVNCQWGGWNQFSICSKSCGSGTQTRNRSKTVTEMYGGTCNGIATETRTCNTQICFNSTPPPPPPPPCTPRKRGRKWTHARYPWAKKPCLSPSTPPSPPPSKPRKKWGFKMKWGCK